MEKVNSGEEWCRERRMVYEEMQLTIWLWTLERHHGTKYLFVSRISYKVGNSKRISFWGDKWCSTVLLENVFPQLFEITKTKVSSIAELHITSMEGAFWPLDFDMRLTDSEIEEFAKLLETLEKVELSDQEDGMVWEEGKNGFHVCLLSESLNDKRRLDGNLGILRFPYKRIWKAKYLPPKVAFFCWIALRGRILTIDKLKIRGMQILNRCFLCKTDEESVEHITNNCSWVHKI